MNSPDYISIITHMDTQNAVFADLWQLPPGKESTYAILNADDDEAYELRDELFCQIALFSLYPENRRIKKHCRTGGLAAILENKRLVLCKGGHKIPLLQLPERDQHKARELLTQLLAFAIKSSSLRQISQNLRKLLSEGPFGSKGGMAFPA